MKRVCLFAAILSIVVACEMRPNGEKLVIDYLQRNTNGIEYSIVEISALDSLYSPFEVINSLLLNKSSRYAELSKQLAGIYEKPTMKDRRAAASKVAELAYDEYHSFDDSFDIIHALTDRYYNNRPANLVGYRVKYKVDGVIEEDVFYLNRDLGSVGHTASELMSSYQKVVELNNKFFSLKMDAEDIARTIR